jgi:hypothetical protein
MKRLCILILSGLVLASSSYVFADDLVLTNVSGCNADLTYSAVFEREKSSTKTTKTIENLELAFVLTMEKKETIKLLESSINMLPEEVVKDLKVNGYKLIEYKLRKVTFEIKVLNSKLSAFTSFLPTQRQMTYLQDPILGTLPTSGRYNLTFRNDTVSFLER